MSWGSALAGAWNAATEGARAAAQAIGNTARAAYDYATGAANRAVSALEGLASSFVAGLVGVAVKAYQAVASFFDGSRVGRPTMPCPHAGGGTPGAGGGTQPGGQPGGNTPPPVVDDYNIVAVNWLNGDDVTIIGDCTQFVNLPRDAKWLADSDIANIDRLGINPRFLVTFDRPGSFGFQWRILPVAGGTPAYSAAEEGRNANFVPASKEWALGSTAGDGRAVIADAARLVAGGGYKFKIEAKDDKGKVVTSGVITTKRLFWYIELPMTGLTGALSSTASLDSEFAGHHIVLKQLADIQIPMQQNIGDNAASTTLASNISSAIAGNATASAKAPYLIRIAYTNHLAVKNPNQRQRLTGATVGPGVAAVTINVAAQGLLAGSGVAPRSLWKDIVTGESWFVSALYSPDDGSAAVAIDTAKVTAVGAGPSHRAVSVDVTGLAAGTGTIDVFVNVVDRMRAGLAIGGAANICVCTIAWWTQSTQDEQVGTVIHELGHKVQMVVDGTGSMPDRVSTQYSGSGHAGSHCHNGCPAGQANYATTPLTDASSCVMFGTINGHNSFCGNCAPAVKKVDLGAGF